ncbi:MAG: SLBB domain-containing protein [Flavobacteriaceae bacterium]
MKEIRIFIITLFILSAGLTSLQAQRLPSGMSRNQAEKTLQSANQEQLKGYINQAKESGYSLNDVKSILRAQGASLEDINQLEELWDATETDTAITDPTFTSFQSNFGINPLMSDFQDDVDDENDLFRIKRFGSNYFNQKQSTTETTPQLYIATPQLYIATPSDYQLGPGDELLITLYGASEESYTVQLSREGTIKVDRLAPIFLSGLSISEAKKRLTERFSVIYTGLLASANDPSKVSLTLSLQNARSVVVNITGQVENPGTYTLSAYTSVLNALYAAGGPNQVGSYRAVKLLRGGKIFKEIDLYEFFAGGKLPSIYLQDQDVLQVPAYDSQVELKGAFKTTGYFELKKEESLLEVLRFSGGFLSDGYKEQVFVSRIVDFKRQSITLKTREAAMHLLKDGDVLEATWVNKFVENTVQIEGAVYVPGTYSLNAVQSVGDLLKEAGGLTQQALSSEAILFRKDKGIENTIINIDLNSQNSLIISLKDGDRLFIANRNDLSDLGKITVRGEVNRPGVYTFKQGMTLTDALILAKGFTSDANIEIVSVYLGSIYQDEAFTQAENYIVNKDLTTKSSIPLEVNSLIVVRKRRDITKIENVTLEGLSVNPGVYAIKNNNYRLYDLLKESGGLLKNAYLKGISISRAFNNKSKEASILNQSVVQGENSIQSDLDLMNNQNDSSITDGLEDLTIVIGIDGDKLMNSRGEDLTNNPILEDGDQIFVPKMDNTITIIGQVQKSSKVVFDKKISLREAIYLSGGFNQDAKKSKSYVVYKNGTIKSRKKLLGILYLDPKLEPGATIVVPQKRVRENRTSITEIVGITSSLATVALLIRQLGL